MDVKEFLSKGRQLNFELTELREARSKAFGAACKAVIGGAGEKVQTSPGNVSEDKFISFSDYSTEINRRIVELSCYRSRMLRVIYTVENSTYRALLIARYINCKTWEQVAESLHKDVRYTFKLHKKAVAAVDEKYIIRRS